MALAAFIKHLVDACRRADVPPPRGSEAGPVGPPEARPAPPTVPAARQRTPETAGPGPAAPACPVTATPATAAPACPVTAAPAASPPTCSAATTPAASPPTCPAATTPAASPPTITAPAATTPAITAPATTRPTSPVSHPTGPEVPVPAPVDLDAALAFIEQFYAEAQAEVSDDLREHRLAAVRAEIGDTGSYRHTSAELTFGVRLAWRNAARCIGRLYWQSLRVRDRRAVRAPAEIATECAAHLREVTRNGRIRCTATVFAPDAPGRPGPRIHNEQLIRYAGYRDQNGSVTGDPRNGEFTEAVIARGWRPPSGRPGRFDVLPLLISEDGSAAPEMFELPPDSVLEVELRHPEYGWFAELDLRWHAVPAISHMPLEIGGITYPAAPFNGWYLGTEIGARNLSDVDRYDLLPEIADRLWLDTSSERTLWRDRALVELMRAVQWSFDKAGVQMSDHHSESRRFLEHVAREEAAGRSCPAEWSWIVPPVSGGLTPVFHRYYDAPDADLRPAFLPPPG